MKNMLLSLLAVCSLLVCWGPALEGQETARARGLEVGDMDDEVTGTRRAVVVGISTYLYLPEDNQLQYANNDAIAFRDFLLSEDGGGFDSTNIRLLLDDEADKWGIFEAIQWLTRESTPGDQAVVYFAGHGDVETETIDQTGFLLASDVTESNYFVNGGINVDDLARFVRTMAAKDVQVLVITDACRAGTVVSEEGARLTTAALARDWEQVTKFVSSEAGEVSHEGRQWGGGHGAFTFFLLAGLNGLADEDGDQRVTAGELGRFVSANVARETAGRQNPMRVGRARLPLASVDPERFAQVREEMRERRAGLVVVDVAADETGERLALAGESPDTALAHAVQALEAALLAGALLEPQGRSAWDAYQRIRTLETAVDVLPAVQSKLAAAFQRDVQTVIRQYLTGGNQQPSLGRLRRAVLELDYAGELLGEDDILATSLEARRAFLEGWVMVQSGRHEDALGPLNRSIALEPEAAYAYNALGFALLGLGELEEARKAFDGAIQRAPRWSYPTHGLGLVEAQIGDADVAAGRFREAIEFDPIYRDPRNELLLMQRRETEETEESLLRRIEEEPTGTYWRYELAGLYWIEGRWEGAEAQYREIVRLDSLRADGWTGLGFATYALERHEEGLRQLRRAIDLDPRFELAHRTLAYVLTAIGRTDEALATLRDVLEWGETPEAWTMFSELQLEAGEVDEAEQAVRNALELNPGYAQALETLGDIHRGRGEATEAERRYLEAIEHDSLNAGRWQHLGAFYYDEARYEDAERVSRRASALSPGDPILIKNLAVLNDRLGRDEDAEEFYREALRVDSLSANVQRGFGLFLLSHDRPDEAEPYLRRAVELTPTDPLPMSSLAFFYSERRDWERAERAYRRVVELDPTSFTHRNSLGRFYEERDRYPEALESYAQALEVARSARDSAVALTNMGDVQRLAEDYGPAERNYRAAAAVDSTYVWAVNGLGLLFEARGDHPEAVKQYMRATEMAPTEAVIWRNLGDTRRKAGDLDGAEREYGRSLELDSTYVWAHNGLGLTFRDRGRHDEAERAYRRALYYAEDADDTVTVASNLGWLHVSEEQWPEAEGWFRMSVEADSLEALSRFSILGHVLEQQDRLQEAEEIYRRGTVLDPENPAHHRSLAFLYSARGDTEATEAAYRRAIELDPADHVSLNNLAWLLYGRGDLDEAAELSDRSLAVEDQTPVDIRHALDTRANIWLDAGEPERALELFDRILRDHGEPDVFLHLGRAMSLLEMGDEERAGAAFREALTLEARILDSGFVLDSAGYSPQVVERVRRLRALSGPHGGGPGSLSPDESDGAQ